MSGTAEVVIETKLSERAEDARRSARKPQARNITIYPIARPPEPEFEARLKDVSVFGLGFSHRKAMAVGSEFMVQLNLPEGTLPLLFRITHTRQDEGGQFRSGAQLVRVLSRQPIPSETPIESAANEAGKDLLIMPVEGEQDDAFGMAASSITIIPQSPAGPVAPVTVATPTMALSISADSDDTDDEMMSIVSTPDDATDVEPIESHTQEPEPSFEISKLAGMTKCGLQRELSISREGNKLYLFVHHPRGATGWGIMVDRDRLHEAIVSFAGASEALRVAARTAA